MDLQGIRNKMKTREKVRKVNERLIIENRKLSIQISEPARIENTRMLKINYQKPENFHETSKLYKKT